MPQDHIFEDLDYMKKSRQRSRPQEYLIYYQSNHQVKQLAQNENKMIRMKLSLESYSYTIG